MERLHQVPQGLSPECHANIQLVPQGVDAVGNFAENQKIAAIRKVNGSKWMKAQK